MRPNVVKKNWNELTPQQQEAATKQMIHAGWRDKKHYPKMIYQVKDDGGIYGWIDKGLSGIRI